MNQPPVDRTLYFGPFVLQPGRKLLLEGQQPVRIGSRSLDLLVALARRPGEVVSREELEACIWPRAVVEETSLRVHASRLRKALRDGQDGARYIVNVPGRGYAFVAQVTTSPVEPPRDATIDGAVTAGNSHQRLVELLTAALLLLGDATQPGAAGLLSLLQESQRASAQVRG